MIQGGEGRKGGYKVEEGRVVIRLRKEERSYRGEKRRAGAKQILF